MQDRDFELDFAKLQDIADIAFEQSRARVEAEADNLAAEEAAMEWDKLTSAEKPLVPRTDEF